MLASTRHIDVHVTRMTREARWFGVRRVAPRKGSIGIGIAEIVYSLGACSRPVQTERVEPWFSSID